MLFVSEPRSWCSSSTLSRPLTFRCRPAVHAMASDPGGAHPEGECCLRATGVLVSVIPARPPRKRMFFGAQSLHANFGITACTVHVYASWATSRWRCTQDSVLAVLLSPDGARGSSHDGLLPAGRHQLSASRRSRDAHHPMIRVFSHCGMITKTKGPVPRLSPGVDAIARAGS